MLLEYDENRNRYRHNPCCLIYLNWKLARLETHLNQSLYSVGVTYSCLSEKVKFPAREYRRFLNVHGAAGVLSSEALGFPQHNLHSAVGKKHCFTDVFLLETFPSRAGEAAFSYEAGSCSS